MCFDKHACTASAQTLQLQVEPLVVAAPLTRLRRSLSPHSAAHRSDRPLLNPIDEYASVSILSDTARTTRWERLNLPASGSQPKVRRCALDDARWWGGAGAVSVSLLLFSEPAACQEWQGAGTLNVTIQRRTKWGRPHLTSCLAGSEGMSGPLSCTRFTNFPFPRNPQEHSRNGHCHIMAEARSESVLLLGVRMFWEFLVVPTCRCRRAEKVRLRHLPRQHCHRVRSLASQKEKWRGSATLFNCRSRSERVEATSELRFRTMHLGDTEWRLSLETLSP